MMRRFTNKQMAGLALSCFARTNATNSAQAHNATSTAATSSSSVPKAAVSKKVNVVDFEKKFLQHRVWASYHVGRHISVYNDSNIISWIVMDRDGSSANALGEEFVSDLSKAIDKVEELAAKGETQFAILTSAKSTFCVGADIDQMYPLVDREKAFSVPTMGHELFNRIEKLKTPVVAAVNGLALGGGFELALACHKRVVSSTAKLGFPECQIGLLPGGGGTVRTQRLCGLTNAVTWIMSSKQLRAPQAKSAGACDVVLGGEDRYTGENRFLEEVRRWAGKALSDKKVKPSTRPAPRNLTDRVMRLAESTSFGRKKIGDEAIKGLNKQTKGKYIAHYKALECILYSSTHSNEQGYKKECEGFADLLLSPEAKNMMSLYFLDEGMKKSEQKTGIPKSDIPPIRKVGVIGAGVMGSGIAQYFINKGIPVAMKDLKEEVVKSGIERVRGEFAPALKRKRLTPKEVEDKMALLTTGTTDEVLKDCDIVVEAAVEIMEVKKKLIQQLEADGVIHSKNIFATNTSSLSLSEMQTVSKNPANIVGMHFFNPVAKMPLVEVIKGKETSKEAAALIFHLALQTGKKPIIVNDGPGFLVNRILGVYMAEAGRLVVEEKCSATKVDEAILAFGMPMGPFRLLDEVGLDVACHVGPVLQNGLKSDRFAVGAEINTMLKDGMLGKKNGKGFYNYDEKGKEKGFNDATLKKYFGQSSGSSGLSASEIVDRCVLLMVNEASLILEEGIAQSPEDVDIGMVFGTGFPPFRGGLMQYADHRGAEDIVKTLKELQTRTGSDRFKPSPMLEKMAVEKKRFFPNRPFVPYKERVGYPRVIY